MCPAAVRQLVGVLGSDGMGSRRRRTEQRGFGLIEIVLVLVVVAFAGLLLARYLGSTAKTVESIQ